MEEKKAEIDNPAASDVEGHVESPSSVSNIIEDPDPGATEEERRKIVCIS